MGEWVSNPGSVAARQQGCICPVLDNNHGNKAPWDVRSSPAGRGWWITGGCPLHDTRKGDTDG